MKYIYQESDDSPIRVKNNSQFKFINFHEKPRCLFQYSIPMTIVIIILAYTTLNN